MNKIKSLIGNVFSYLDCKENEKTQTETINLLMKLTFSCDIIEAVEVKQKFDALFLENLAQKKIEFENNLKAVNSYAN